MYSPTFNLDKDLNTQNIEQAAAILSHLSYHEASNSLTLEAWISPANRFKLLELGQTAYLDLRTFSADSTQTRWLEKFSSQAQKPVKVQSVQFIDSNSNDYQRVRLELLVPKTYLNQNTDTLCQLSQFKDHFHEIIDSAVLM
ncbi:hypothetical protein BY458DRAFT_582737 [Sporodiniella umbellata]|nr:hypothetical protein BY458DRAFT_582737 [Sporodiniella umbellata]